jgi:uncharacterized protein (DUF488 family)
LDTLWSIGSSTLAIEEFIALLKAYGIEQLADVRHYPASRFEHFRKANLAGSLEAAGISYVWLGESLGGYRKGGYEAYMATEAFKAGLEELMALARQKKTAIMCGEKLPWKCHRRFIGAALAAKGWQIIHIIDAKRTWDGIFTRPPRSKKQAPSSQLPGLD